jgi:hypothetical protein
MAIVFPSNPITNDTFTVTGPLITTTYVYTGSSWKAQGTSGGVAGPQGTAGPSTDNEIKVSSIQYANSSYVTNANTSTTKNAVGYIVINGTNFASDTRVYISGTGSGYKPSFTGYVASIPNSISWTLNTALTNASSYCWEWFMNFSSAPSYTLKTGGIGTAQIVVGSNFLQTGSVGYRSESPGYIGGSMGWVLNRWYHVAYYGNSSTSYFAINGNVTNVGLGGDGGYSASGSWGPGLNIGGSNTLFANMRCVSGNTVYGTSNFTPPDVRTPLTAITGTQLLTLNSGSFTDTSGNGISISTGSGSTLTQTTTFVDIGDGSAPLCTSTYVNSTQLNVQIPALNAGSYFIHIYNNNGRCISVPNVVTYQ